MRRIPLVRPLACAGLVAALTAACGGATQGSGSEEAGGFGPDVTVTLAHPFPGEHPMQVEMIEPFVQQVEQRTEGTVTFEIHPGGALTDATTAYENTVSGAIDVGWALQGYTAGRFPLTQIVELPFVFDSAVQATETLWTLYEEFPALQEEYGDVKVLALWTHDIGGVWTVDRPVRSPEDMSGLVMRSPGTVQNDLIEAFGGSAAGMPAPEVYDSLERGVIDGLMIAPSGINSFNLHEVINHGTIGGFYTAAQFLVMNKQTWDSLSSKQQQAIDELAGRQLSLVAARAYDEAHQEALENLPDRGVEVHSPSDDELDVWQRAADGVIENWIAENEANGAPAQQMYDREQELTGGQS